MFQVLFKERPHLKQLVSEKIVPIAGDLVNESLGLSAHDRAMVVAETQIVINCAASVNFDDPLLDAFQINYFGTLRMYELASQCVNIQCFTHISTAYTNSNFTGHNFIEERVYDLKKGENVEDLVAKIMSLSEAQVQSKEREILKSYPNTYTYTKSMAERFLKDNHGNVPTTIIRPSIIISCYDEPF